jgi:hypothetical protein
MVEFIPKLFARETRWFLTQHVADDGGDFPGEVPPS